jgi:uncharacterized protein YbbK (DUF523 family)
MKKILVSGCLLGRQIRYDGSSKAFAHPLLDQWTAEGRIVAICPELSAGFSVPRPPAEISGRLSGEAVLEQQAQVVENTGRDVTDLFLAAAQSTLDLARSTGCEFALLTDGSPSCGSTFIYDGTFSGATHRNSGVTAALLRRNGIEVFAHSQIEQLAARLHEERPD